MKIVVTRMRGRTSAWFLVAILTCTWGSSQVELPPAFVGSWEGIVHDDSPPGFDYTFKADLQVGSTGELVGTFAYPCCGGNLRLLEASDAQVELAEEYTYNPCGCVTANARARLVFVDINTLRLEWHYAGDTRIWVYGPLKRKVTPCFQMQPDPPSGAVPLQVEFDASCSTTPEGTTLTGLSWDFGDGAAAEGAKVLHTFTEPGRFVVTFTATNDSGGMGAARQTVTATGTAGDLLPWSASDVGLPAFPGSAWRDGDDILLCAGGKTLVGGVDEFYFIHQALTGNFAAVVRVSEINSWVAGASLGLMVRGNLSSSSQHAAILLERVSTGFRYRLRYRQEEGRSSRSDLGTFNEPPCWLRIERRGELIFFLGSSDGIAWIDFGRQTIPGLSESVLCGVAACGRDPGNPAQPFTPVGARLSALAIVAVEQTFSRGDSNADGATDISDAVAVLNFLFLGVKKVSCEQAGDANDDGTLDISDAIHLLGFLFLGKDAIQPPVGACGVDLTGHSLSCESFPGCP